MDNGRRAMAKQIWEDGQGGANGCAEAGRMEDGPQLGERRMDGQRTDAGQRTIGDAWRVVHGRHNIDGQGGTGT